MYKYIKHSTSYNYLLDHFNFLNLVMFARSSGKKLKLRTVNRHFIDRYKCIEHVNPDITLSNYWLSGSLIYTRSGYNIRCFSYDDIIYMEAV